MGLRSQFDDEVRAYRPELAKRRLADILHALFGNPAGGGQFHVEVGMLDAELGESFVGHWAGIAGR